jgi:hypothetical protein
MLFCLETFKFQNFEIRTFTTLETHNFLCKSVIQVRFEAKLWPSSKAFQ